MYDAGLKRCKHSASEQADAKYYLQAESKADFDALIEVVRRFELQRPHVLTKGGSPLWAKVREAAKSIASSVAESIKSLASPLGSPPGSPLGSPRRSREPEEDRFSRATSSAASSIASSQSAAGGVADDQDVLHWRAVAREELAERLEVRRALRHEEEQLREALEEEARGLQVEREQDAEIAQLQDDLANIRADLLPLKELVAVLQHALEQRDDQAQAQHSANVSRFLADNEALRGSVRRLEQRIQAEESLLHRLGRASGAPFLSPAALIAGAEKTPDGGKGGGGVESGWSDLWGEEADWVRLQVETSQVLDQLRNCTSDIHSILHGTDICPRSGDDDAEAGQRSSDGGERRRVAAMVMVSEERIRRKVGLVDASFLVVCPRLHNPLSFAPVSDAGR